MADTPKQQIIANNAPKPIGLYSHAIRAGGVTYLSGQLGIESSTGELISDDIESQVKQTFENISAVAMAAGGTINDIVKLTVYLMNLQDVQHVNEAIKLYFADPFPARTAIQVSALPKQALVEIDAVLVID